jgi:hypothetical protein
MEAVPVFLVTTCDTWMEIHKENKYTFINFHDMWMAGL